MRALIFASSRKRRAASGVRATCGSMNLIANSRSVKTLVADHTDAIPPVPSKRFRRYLPAMVCPVSILLALRSPPCASELALLADGQPSVDYKRMSSQEARGIAREIERATGDLIRRTVTAERRSPDHDLDQIVVLQDRAREPRVDEARGDRVDADPGRPELERERLGHRDDRGLRHRVDALHRRRDDSRDARDVDDRAGSTPRGEVARHFSRAPEVPLEVDVERLVP